MEYIHLQGIGKRKAIQAKHLKEGMILICNFGYTEEVKSVEISKSGKSVKTVILSGGKLYNKQFRVNTLLAVEGL